MFTTTLLCFGVVEEKFGEGSSCLRRNGSAALLPGLTRGDPCPEDCVPVETGSASAPTRYVSSVLPAVAQDS